MARREYPSPRLRLLGSGALAARQRQCCALGAVLDLPKNTLRKKVAEGVELETNLLRAR